MPADTLEQRSALRTDEALGRMAEQHSRRCVPGCDPAVWIGEKRSVRQPLDLICRDHGLVGSFCVHLPSVISPPGLE